MSTMRISRDQTESNFPDNLLNDENEIKKTVGETFNDVRGGNIRVVVRAPDTDKHRKSTRVIRTISELEKNNYICNYLSFKYI
ncbi:unnamed protein product [Rhizophagus irregularis]|uniref:Uncharacterized protein n=1 Tax=Rhizophagus irregularis TaxID=588596 RepID=A0A915ZC06_9GLOM|nr:unnamed protein product [Rhizophagus irregularis]